MSHKTFDYSSSLEAAIKDNEISDLVWNIRHDVMEIER